MEVATTATTATQALIQTIRNGHFNGKSFRYTNGTPRQASVLDWIRLVTNKPDNYVRRLLDTIKTQYPEVVQKMVPHIFAGQGQRATPVATAENLLYIIGKLPRKYIGEFERERDTLMTRYLGGDTSLAPEVEAIREVQNDIATTAPDHPLRVFGEAVESGQVGNLSNMPNNHLPSRSEERVRSGEAYNDQQSAIQENPAINKRSVHCYTNALISRAALGEYPKDFKRQIGVKNYVSSRNHMDAAQLSSVAYMSFIARNFAHNIEDMTEYKEQIVELTDTVYDINNRANVQGNKNVPSLTIPEARRSLVPT